jgi:threonine dehydrogenase-like Zn-dependent dehydrogenase
MKAIGVFPAARDVRIVDHPAPALDSPTAVRLRMIEAGICGTDREICAFDYGTPPAGSDYLVLGHESLGEVIEAGPAVTRVKRGDLVVPMVRRPCARPDCAPCRANRQDFCATGEYTERGIMRAHGFMTGEVVDDERWMNVVPAALREVAVLVEPLTIAEKALLQVELVQQRLPWEARHPGAGASAIGSDPGVWGAPGRRHNAVVIGAGPVGLLGAMALRVRGFETFVYSRQLAAEGRERILAAIGATGIAAEETTPDALAARVGNIDLVYEAAGASAAAFDVMRATGVNSVFVFTGVPGRKGPVPVDTDLLMRDLVLRNQLVLGTVNAGRDAFEAAIRDLGEFTTRWPDATRALISRRVPMAGFHDALLGPPGGIKTVITLDG